jgi:hypothetical protein
MPDLLRVLLNGTPAAPEFYTQLALLEIEETLGLPSAIQLRLPLGRTAAGDLDFINEGYFQPFASIAVVVGVEGREECIFDGFVLSQRVHLERGITASTLDVWGQDVSWLMNLEEKTREWADMTAGGVANAIFGEYGFTPVPENTQDDTPAHTEAGHTLMQRGTDAQFLRMLAQRSGKLMRVITREKAGEYFGVFAVPDLAAQPVCTLKLNDPESWNTSALDLSWDVTQPSAVKASQALFTDNTPDGAAADTSDSGLPLLDERSLADFAGQEVSVRLTTFVDDVGALGVRARAVLRDAGWFVKCEGESDLSRLKTVLRPGTVVQLDGLGIVLSGKYFLWSVRHVISPEAHRMRFVLSRNAVGPVPAGGGLLGGLL